MDERIFSGKRSQKFWDAVNESKSNILFNYGCKAQELEQQRDDLLDVCEGFMKAWLPPETRSIRQFVPDMNLAYQKAVVVVAKAQTVEAIENA